MSSEVRSLPFDIHANSLLAATFSDPAEVLSSPILSATARRDTGDLPSTARRRSEDRSPSSA